MELLIFAVLIFWIYCHYDLEDTKEKVRLAELLLEIQKNQEKK